MMTMCHKPEEDTSHLDQIRILYTELAEAPQKDFGWGKGKDNARTLGYAEEWLRTIPDVVWESAAAVGNPFSMGPIDPGSTVVDLGCGAGADACVAASLVGSAGRVVGIDCTSAMITKARGNASACELSNLEFHEADMASLPMADASADIVLSNGAINLSPDKARVLAEAYRVLRVGGRIQLADMVRDATASESACGSGQESWADCVTGTLKPDDFLALMRAAGFANVRLVAYTGYRTAQHTEGALFYGEKTSPSP
jgi:arsenite methyltransferase